MKCWNTILSQGLMTLFLVTASRLNAADQPPKEVATKTVAEPNAAAAWQRRVPELFSDNLPLEEIIRLLRQQFPEINFLVKPQSDTDADLNATSVKMVLRAVTLEEILKALELAAARPIQITGGPDGRLVVFERKPGPVRVLANGLPDTGDTIETRVFSIAAYLDYLSDEKAALALKELEDVLRTAGKMQTDANKGARVFDPKLHIHRSTKLLIAVGRPEELYVVEQVVKELQPLASAPSAASRPEVEKRREEFKKTLQQVDKKSLQQVDQSLILKANPPGEPPAGAKP